MYCVFYFIQYSRKNDLISTDSDTVLQAIAQQEEKNINVAEEIKVGRKADKQETIMEEVKADKQETITEEVKADKQETITEEVKADKQETITEDLKILDETALEQEVTKPIKFLENPLPVPKKRERKEMDYAFEPSPDQMHYDLNNYNLDDDYDLKD